MRGQAVALPQLPTTDNTGIVPPWLTPDPDDIPKIPELADTTQGEPNGERRNTRTAAR